MTIVKYVIPFLFASSALFSLSSDWNINMNGSWATGVSTHWTAGVPNAVDDVAGFLGIITAPRIVSLSQATTVGALDFDNANAYTIESNILTFQKTTGSAQVDISGGTGTHVVSSNVILGSDLVIDHNVLSNVSFSGAISGSKAITVQGNNGQILFTGSAANTFTGLTTVNTTLAAAGITLQKTGAVAIPGDALISFGALTTAAASQFGNTSEVTINGPSATLAIGAFPQTVGHLNYQAGVFTAGAGVLSLASNLTALTLGNNVTVNPALSFTGSGGIVMSPIAGSSATLAGAVDLGTSLHEVSVPPGVAGLTTTGIISGAGGGFIKIGPGTLTLAGAASNTYSGFTAVNEGTLALNHGATIAIPGNVLINGGTLTLLTGDQIANTSTMLLQSGTFNMGGFTEALDRLDFTGGTVTNSGGLTLESPTTALQMSGGTLIENIVISNATGGTAFDASMNGTATIGGSFFYAAGSHPFNIENGSANIDMEMTAVIDGPGDMVKAGAGTLELGGGASNTLMGMVTVNEGVLSLNKTGGSFAIPAAAAGVTVNGGIALLRGAQQIASNQIVTMNGGIFDLNGNNQTLGTLNYLGGNLIQSGGVLALTSAANALTMGATTINGDVIIQPGGPVTFNGVAGTAVINGTLTLASQNSFNINDGPEPFDMVINSQITGPGGVSKTGLGTLVLSGENNYTGQTIVTQGVLQGNSTSFPPVVTTITSPGTLVFDQTFDGTFLGTLGGNGDMIKEGAARLRFSTPQIVGGVTTVAGGTLLVNSTLGGAGPLNVNPGTTLAGIGTIDKNVTVNGTLNPGDNGIGTLTLNGVQTLGAGSILDIELTPTLNDLVLITGTISIEPNATFDFFPMPALYVEPLNYTVIQTTGGRTGTFDHISDPFPLFTGTATYDANNVYLTVSLLPISSLPGLSRNARKVAHCLEKLNPQPGSDLYKVTNSFRFVSTIESIEKSLLDMQPSLFASLAAIKQESTLYIRNALFSRLESRTRSCMSEPTGYRYWAAPLIGVSQENNHGKEAGYNALTPGIAVGVDGWLFPDLQIGGSLGYTNSAVHWKKKRGDGRVHGVYGSVYSRLGSQVGFLEGAVILGYDQYSTQRDIHIGGLLPINRRAKASHYGLEASGHVKGAFQFPVEKTLLGPYASLDYQYQYEDSFDEHGAKSLNLDVSRKYANFMQGEMGMDVAHCFHLDRKTLTPYIQVSGIGEKRFNGAKEESSFGGCSIDVYGYYRSRFLVGAGGGFDVKWALKTAPRASFNYKGKYGLGYQDHSFNLILIY